MRLSSLSTLLICAACSEYDLASTHEPVGLPNPAQLDNPVRTDRIVQVTTPTVDVLWVIDNSGSMGDEQAALAQNFPVFMSYFLDSGLEYHLGVVSTDMNDPLHSGKLRDIAGLRWIDEETADPNAIFRDMAQMGVDGYGTEKGIGASYTALEVRRDGFNAGFLRDDASLHTIVISDEEDQTEPDDGVTKAEFISFLEGEKVEGRDVTFSSIVNHPDCACPPIGDEQPGKRYLDVTFSVGGIAWDITTQVWETVLEQLGVQAAGLKREFFLAQLPVPESIVVSVVDAGVRHTFVAERDWRYDATRNSVTFTEYIPNPLAEVFVEYEVLSAYQGHAG